MKNKNTKAINEAILREDPIFKSWNNIGIMLSERRMSEKEILQIFADVETKMTDKATGANRTMLGRGKDVTVDFAKDVAGAVSGILDSIQKSVPVSAVDVAYDQATDALSRVAGGQKGKVMQAIKTYRNLVKQYPKAAGFAKAALVAIAGFATGGAGLPVIAGLTYALDSAIRGDKLSSVLGKGAGAAALAAAAQGLASGASQTGTADTGAFTDVNQMGDYTGPPGGLDDTGAVTPGTPSAPVVPPVNLQTYTVQPGDTLSDIALRFKTSVRELQGLNPQLATAQSAVGGQMPNPDVIFPGQELTLPAPSGDSVYAGGVGTSADTMSQIGRGNIPNSAISQRMAQRESVEFVKLPFEELVDAKTTLLFWTLKESVGRKEKKLYLSDQGVDAVFENVERYKNFLIEKAGVPGSTRPAEYRPDMPGGSGKKVKQGMIGKGLDWLDKKTKAVGGALSNFGHQFTTDVTKEKLKMNWHQKGKPSDSDALAAWLVTQGVPQQVVSDIYQSMGIPLAAPAPAPAPAAATTPTAASAPTSSPAPAPTSSPAPTPAAKTSQAMQPQGFNAGNIGNLKPTPGSIVPNPAPVAKTSQTMQPQGFNAGNIGNLKPTPGSIVPKPAAKPAADFSKSPTGYGKQTMTVSPMTSKEKQKQPAMAESLTWSKGFNPGGTLFGKMARNQQLASKISEMASGMGAGSVATSMGGGNGFANGGPGTISRAKPKKAKK